MWTLWQNLKNEETEDGERSVLDQCFFDVPRYMLEMYKVLQSSGHLNQGSPIPEILAGGSTQMGKTMFVVIGVCVAKALNVASIVITNKVVVRNSLSVKIHKSLQGLSKTNKIGVVNLGVTSRHRAHPSSRP